MRETLSLDGVLVGRGRTLVLGLLHLVGDGTHGAGSTVGEGVLAGNLGRRLDSENGKDR